LGRLVLKRAFSRLASTVVIGTAATMPTPPASVRTISWAMSCEPRIASSHNPVIDDYGITGSAAPA
jgi:hypothetical protein